MLVLWRTTQLAGKRGLTCNLRDLHGFQMDAAFSMYQMCPSTAPPVGRCQTPAVQSCMQSARPCCTAHVQERTRLLTMYSQASDARTLPCTHYSCRR
jgi:hypothetical protein